MPISTLYILNTFNNAIFKWFWPIFSLGAPAVFKTRLKRVLKQRDCVFV